MANKYFGGEINAACVENELDEDLKNTALQTVSSVLNFMNEYHTADALQKIIALAQRSNKYIDETAPWVLAKDEASLPRLKTVLSNLIEAIRFIGVLLAPFLPATSASHYRANRLSGGGSGIPDGIRLRTCPQGRRSKSTFRPYR